MGNEVSIGVKSTDDGGKGFKAAERDLGKLKGTMRSVEQVAGKLGQGMKSAAGKLGEGLKGALSAGPGVALGAGVAVGGMLIGGITSALKADAIKAKLGAQLGLAGADADKFGAAAGDLYKSGWGESLEETAAITKAAFENGLVSVRSSREEIKKVGEQVAVYAELTGGDALESTRAVAQMIKTGLAKNSQEAFDILVRGQQLGINKSEDLLDTFNEYGTQFRKLGLDAKDSLGLMNQLIQGGARDSDVAADAIKEFSIRAIDGSKATAEGFRALGLDAGKMTDAIAKGGPSARTAFGDILDGLNKISDPVKRDAAGVALFGTQWEDLGGAIRKADLGTAAGSLGQVAGATQRANDALSATPAAKIEAFKRVLTQTFVDLFVKHALPTVTKFVDWLSGPGLYKIGEWALGGTEFVIGFVDKFLSGLDTLLGAVQGWGKAILYAMAATLAPFNLDLAKAMYNAADSVDDWAGSTRQSIQGARNRLGEWNRDVSRMKTEVKLKADKADLERKLAAAKKELKDPNLTKERRARLNATITQLTAQVNAAQRKIDSLHGKTVSVTTNIYRNIIETRIPGGDLIRTRASGGAVSAFAAGGTPSSGKILVGETGPEFLSISGGRFGHVTPAANTRWQRQQEKRDREGYQRIVMEVNSRGSDLDDLILAVIRRAVKVRGGDVQVVLGGKGRPT